MALTQEQKTVISIFSQIANNNYKDVSNSVDFILDNMQEIVGVSKQLGLKEGVLAKFMKKDPAINEKLEAVFSDMGLATFKEYSIIYEKILGKDSDLYKKKSNLVKINDIGHTLRNDDIELVGVKGQESIAKVVSILDQVKSKDMEEVSRNVFVLGAFNKLGRTVESYTVDMTKNLMQIFKHPEFLVMTKESIKKNKSLEKAVVGNVTRSVNMASQWTLKNIYPKGQFGFIKPSEYQEILNVYGEIINTHKLNVSAKQITPALKFKADCKEYSKNNGTEEVSELKYRQVQATIDDFIDTIKKPLQVLKKDGSTQEFDISKVNKALEWATAKPKM